MAIGLGLGDTSRRRRRAGRFDGDRGNARATVREVCLIGVDRRSPAGEWPAGREVTWLGRTYEVRAAGREGPHAGPEHEHESGPAARCYVHLAPRLEVANEARAGGS